MDPRKLQWPMELDWSRVETGVGAQSKFPFDALRTRGSEAPRGSAKMCLDQLAQQFVVAQLQGMESGPKLFGPQCEGLSKRRTVAATLQLFVYFSELRLLGWGDAHDLFRGKCFNALPTQPGRGGKLGHDVHGIRIV